MLTEQDVQARLREAIRAAGSQKAYAAEQGISEQYIGDVLHGRRKVGQKILDALGLERVVLYRAVTQAATHGATPDLNARHGATLPEGSEAS